MIVHDLHVHSVRSACGLHTVLEIVEIAARKGIRTVNISDHGSASGVKMNFGVVSDRRRCPQLMKSLNGREVQVLFGVEVNIQSILGESDYPESWANGLDLISAGFHGASAGALLDAGSAGHNTDALERYLERHPLDILTHPCIRKFPLDIERVVALAEKHGFALEVNNTNLVVDKTDHVQLTKMIEFAQRAGVALVENSDGHTYFEIGENDKINEFLTEMGVDGDRLLLNRNEDSLAEFFGQRRAARIRRSA